jgi:hypothetical protein
VQGVEVEAGQFSEVLAHSGIRLDVAEQIPSLDLYYGWWGIVPTGGSPYERIHWARNSDVPLIAPPGTYDIYWVQSYDSEPVLIGRDVVVEPGAILQLEVSGDNQGPTPVTELP